MVIFWLQLCDDSGMKGRRRPSDDVLKLRRVEVFGASP